jgi:hypothetical protein
MKNKFKTSLLLTLLSSSFMLTACIGDNDSTTTGGGNAAISGSGVVGCSPTDGVCNGYVHTIAKITPFETYMWQPLIALSKPAGATFKGVANGFMIGFPAVFGALNFFAVILSWNQPDPTAQALENIQKGLEAINANILYGLQLSSTTIAKLDQLIQQGAQQDWYWQLKDATNDINEVDSLYKAFSDSKAFGDTLNEKDYPALFKYATDNCNNQMIQKTITGQTLRQVALKFYGKYINSDAGHEGGAFWAALADSQKNYQQAFLNGDISSIDLIDYMKFFNYQMMLYSNDLYGAWHKLRATQMAALSYYYACPQQYASYSLAAFNNLDKAYQLPVINQATADYATKLASYHSALDILLDDYSHKFGESAAQPTPHTLQSNVQQNMLKLMTTDQIVDYVNTQLVPAQGEGLLNPADFKGSTAPCSLTQFSLGAGGSVDNYSPNQEIHIGASCVTNVDSKGNTTYKELQISLPYRASGNQISAVPVHNIHYDQASQTLIKDAVSASDIEDFVHSVLPPQGYVGNWATMTSGNNSGFIKLFNYGGGNKFVGTANVNLKDSIKALPMNFAPQLIDYNDNLHPNGWEGDDRDSYRDYFTQFFNGNRDDDFAIRTNYDRYEMKTMGELWSNVCDGGLFGKNSCPGTINGYKIATTSNGHHFLIQMLAHSCNSSFNDEEDLCPDKNGGMYIKIACLEGGCFNLDSSNLDTAHNQRIELLWSDGTSIIENLVKEGQIDIWASSIGNDNLVVKKFGFIEDDEYKKWTESNNFTANSFGNVAYLDGRVSVEANGDQIVKILTSSSDGYWVKASLSLGLLNHQLVIWDNNSAKVTKSVSDVVGIERVSLENGDIHAYDINDQIVWSLENVYKAKNKLWVADPTARLVMQDDGNLVLYSSDTSGQIGYSGKDGTHPNYTRVIWALNSNSLFDGVDNGSLMATSSTLNDAPIPSGNYVDACYGITWQNGYLSGLCLTDSASWQQTLNYSNLLDSQTKPCVADSLVYDNNGRLECRYVADSNYTPGGSYPQTCENISWNPSTGILTASCISADKASHHISMLERNVFCTQNTISNRNGQLTCDN